MRAAPPATATLTQLAAKTLRARRAPACACAPPRCAHTHPQVTNAALIINIKEAHKLNKLAMVLIAPLW